MTDGNQIDENRECGGDVAAYALGALETAEQERFGLHLETCVVCRDELGAFQQVVDVLPMSAPPYPAPASLRRSLMHAVDNESRLDPAASDRRNERTRPRRRRFTLPRPALAFGAALAVAVVAVVLALGGSSSSSSGPRPRVIDAQVTGQGTASLQLSKGHAELVVHRFAAPPAGQIYEVWLQRGTSTTPAKAPLFDPTGQGDANVDLSGDLRGVSHVLVTREPAGGTSKPTHPPVISAELT
ncbi:MAG: anti-sigma factor domain-containing protein [Solirubrobacteraceae bacterium]